MRILLSFNACEKYLEEHESCQRISYGRNAGLKRVLYNPRGILLPTYHGLGDIQKTSEGTTRADGSHSKEHLDHIVGLLATVTAYLDTNSLREQDFRLFYLSGQQARSPVDNCGRLI